MIPIPTQEPEVVLFDMDGILFDTMSTHASSWSQTAAHFGLKAREEEFYLFEGMKGTQTIQELYQRQYHREPDPAFVEEVYQYKCETFRSIQTEILPIPGVKTLIEYLHHRNRKIGVVTGSTRHNTEERIRTSLGDCINLNNIVTADDVTNGKPNPEPYLKGVELFGVSPSNTLVVENAPLGVRSAAQAQIFTVAITTGPIPNHILRQEGAQLIMPKMTALLAWWRVTFGN